MKIEEKERLEFLRTLEPRAVAILAAVGARAGRKVSEAELDADIASARKEARAAMKARDMKKRKEAAAC